MAEVAIAAVILLMVFGWIFTFSLCRAAAKPLARMPESVVPALYDDVYGDE
jgi:hypothetical protein